jgi:predicted patatin/cPLA2 family phospholipase
VIRPEEALGISRVEKDPEELLRVYMMGRRVMTERMPELLKFLGR